MYRQVVGEAPVGSPVFLMRLVEGARHVEVQLVGDEHGNVAILGGRDCSMQRRHQKIVEEALVVPSETMRRMELCSKSLASLVGYRNAGTIEYLFDEKNNSFYFLELNPRLQVEHPVTEAITGINLPALQLLMAMGCDLQRVDRARDFVVTDGADYDPFERIGARHAVAARITAENTADAWRPTVGSIDAIAFQPLPNAWGYFSVNAFNSSVHQFADSQFGHIFALGPTRDVAIGTLLMALDGLAVRGEICTNIAALKGLVASDAFRAGPVDTAWLDRRIAAGEEICRGPPLPTVAICASLMIAQRMIDATVAKISHEYIGRSSQPPEALVHSLVSLRTDFVCSKKQFSLEVYRRAPALFSVAANGSLVQAKLQKLPAPETFMVSFGDHMHTVVCQDDSGGGLRLTVDGHVAVIEKEKDPSQVTTAYTGKVTRFLAANGDHVDKGAPIAELEVMKMLCTVASPEAGHISLERPPGSFVEAGDLIATLQLDDPNLVERPAPFVEPLGDFAPIIDDTKGQSAAAQLRALSSRLECIFDGFLDDEEEVLRLLYDTLSDPTLLRYELQEALRRAGAAVPPRLADQLRAIEATAASASRTAAGPANDIGARVLHTINAHRAVVEEAAAARGASEAEQAAEAADFGARVAPLTEFGHAYAKGMSAQAWALVGQFVQRYLKVESLYSAKHTMAGLLQACDSDPAKLVHTFLAHAQLERRTRTLLELIDIATLDGAGAGDAGGAVDQRIAMLRPLAALEGIDYTRVQSRARQLLGAMTDDMAAHMTKQLYPSLHGMAAGTLSDEETLAFTRYLRSHMHVAQPLLFKAYAESTSNVRKAVARTLVHLWYGHTTVSNVVTKVYFHEGKDKSVVSWDYEAEDVHDGASGILVFFSSREDMQTHFSWLCSCISGVDPARARKSTGMQRSMSSTKNIAGLSDPSPPTLPTEPRTLHVIIMGDVALEHKWKAHRRSNATATAAPTSPYDTFDDAGTARFFQDFVKANGGSILSLGASKVAVSIPTPTRDSMQLEALMSVMVTPTYTFAAPDFVELTSQRHILPQFVPWLELDRLECFDVRHEVLPVHPLVHVFVGTAKEQAQDRRLFVRAASTTRALVVDGARPRAGSQEAPLSPLLAGDGGGGSDELAAVDERQPIAALKTVLELVQPSLAAAKSTQYSSVHVFLHHRSRVALGAQRALEAFATALRAHPLPDAPMVELEVRLAQADVLAPLGDEAQPESGPMRVIARWSHTLQVAAYREVDRAPQPPALQLIASKPRGDPSNGKSAATPYSLLSLVDQRRMRCHKAGTTYAYDLLDMFTASVKAQWEEMVDQGRLGPEQVPAALVSAVELTLDGDGVLAELDKPRQPGLNSVGMLAWKATLRTPEYPAGRQLVLIANDLSVQNGTFGPKEDDVFKQASALARREKIPRVYVAANSGARFGLSESVKQRFRVQWKDPEDENKGVDYLYLTPKDKDALGDAVVTEEVVAEVPRAHRFFGDAEHGDADGDTVTEVHHKIIAVIGSEEGLGVECLQGSGMIAAETALANKEIFTIALSTSRNIGIGSYVLRLGQRIVQHRAAPIILTGHGALNKLLGNNVYESNLQLGGPEVMHSNGVSHAIVDSDLEGIMEIVKWLSFVPRTADSPPPALTPVDPVERPVTFMPRPGHAYDPRCLIQGDEDTTGLFDEGSFVETLTGWAKTVVVGRARLGGKRMLQPCHPARQLTRARGATRPKPTRQAFPWASSPRRAASCPRPSSPTPPTWSRGRRSCPRPARCDPSPPAPARPRERASPGRSRPSTRRFPRQVWFPDSAYKTAQAIHDFNAGERLPLFILANWRGFSGGRKDMYEEVLKFGSYIVENLVAFDQPVFVYIPPLAEVRGGAWVVIDPQISPRVMEMYASESARGGVLEPAGIAEIKFRRHEVVKAMQRLDPQLQIARARQSMFTKEDVSDFVADRESQLMQPYSLLGELFADLHDRPERMLAKGVIRAVVPWAESRTRFYHRLRRRLAEMPHQRRVESMAKHLDPAAVEEVLQAAIADAAGGEVDTDEAVAARFDLDGFGEAVDAALHRLLGA